MLESIFGDLCKIGALFKISWNKNNSPNKKTNATTKTGHAAATSGPNSPIHIENTIHNNSPNPEIAPESRFKNCLLAVACELPYNFRHRGNAQNPFIIHALKKLVHDEPTHSGSLLCSNQKF